MLLPAGAEGTAIGEGDPAVAQEMCCRRARQLELAAIQPGQIGAFGFVEANLGKIAASRGALGQRASAPGPKS